MSDEANWRLHLGIIVARHETWKLDLALHENSLGTTGRRSECIGQQATLFKNN